MVPITRAAGTELLLINHHSPGDVLMLTAAVRDLHATYPGIYQTAVDTRCPELWLNNPYVRSFDAATTRALRVDCNHPPALDRCHAQTGHYVTSMHQVVAAAIGRDVRVTRLAPDLHLTPGGEGGAARGGAQALLAGRRRR